MLANTVFDILLCNKENTSRGITFVESEKEDYITYKELYDESIKRLAYLRKKGVSPGEEVLILSPDTREFIFSFWSCIMGKMIPIITPFDSQSVSNTVNMLKHIYDVLKCPYIIATKEIIDIIRQYEKSIKPFMILSVESMKNSENVDIKLIPPAPDDVAMVQYSSGSIGEPKGAMLTHKNLMTNIVDIKERLEYTHKDSAINWLPLTHDLGMIGYHVVPIYLQINQYQMSTQLFVKNPILWMNIISKKKLTTAGSPNFGLKHFLRSVEPGKKYDWDLSSFRVFINGAEAISCDLCDEFLNYLSMYKMKNDVIYTAYGMAEAVLAITVPKKGEENKFIKLQRNKIKLGKKIVRSNNDDENTVSFADLGSPMNNCNVRICDSNDKILEEEVVGIIQIQGGNVIKGYYKNADATDKAFTADGWFRTGDIGFITGSDLVVTGRLKDMIIINGVNIFPSDIENIIEKNEVYSGGDIVACGIDKKGKETQSIVVFVKSASNYNYLSKKIKTVIRESMSLNVDEVIFVDEIPKTASGKVQRSKLKEKYENGEFDNLIKEISENTIDKILENRKLESLEDIQGLLMEYCSEVFHFEHVTMEDNLIELGVDSQGVFKIYELINKINKDISVADIFGNPSIGALSEIIYLRLNKDIQSEKLSYCVFSDEFFNQNTREYDTKLSKSISFNIDGERLKELLCKCYKNNISETNLALAAFIIAISRVANIMKIIAHSLLNKYDLIQEQDIDLDDYNNLISLINKLSTGNEHKTYSFSEINKIKKINTKHNHNVVLPFICNEKLLSQDIDLFRYYDLILSINSTSARISLKIKYDKNRYNSNKLEQLIRKFDQAINSIVHVI